MMFLAILSMWLPEGFKNSSWCLWDRRMHWRAARGVYPDLGEAYAAVKLSENIRILIKKYKAAQHER